jgi:glutathione peroxidase
MKNLFMNILCSLIPSFLMTNTVHAEHGSSSGESIYQGTTTSLRGEEVQMSSFKGKVALIVNTASKCGFTGQFEGLEELYNEYKDQGFIVLGFPSNDFGSQEPGSNDDIAEFCKLNYGVTFPMFEKAPVKGEGKQEIYKILTEKSPKDFQGDPGWNFVKFIVDKDGFVRGRFSSMTKPNDKKIKELIESLTKTE